MKNVAIEVNGAMLAVAVDLTKDQGVSKSGKSNIIATTGGKHVEVKGHPGVFFTFTAYRKIEKAAA